MNQNNPCASYKPNTAGGACVELPFKEGYCPALKSIRNDPATGCQNFQPGNDQCAQSIKKQCIAQNYDIAQKLATSVYNNCCFSE